MANFLNEIIESTIQPVKTNVLWIKNGVPYYYNKRWKPLLGGASGGTVDSPITFGEGEYSAILNYSNNNALGSRSIALGYNTTSYNNYEASFGKYNKSVKSEDLTKATLFSVGNGNATFHKNALEIKWDGSVYISGIDKSIQDYLSSIKTYDSEINDILESIKGLSDRITITDSKLETKFEEFEEGINGELEEYYSKLTQTAKEIRAEVGSITTELDGRITENTALISITAKEIRSEVSEITTDLDGRIEANKSSISQTAEEIRAEVSRVQTDLSGRIDTANSTISQTADAIRLEVEAVEGELNGKIEKNTSLINQTAESIGLEVTNLSDHLNDVNSELAGLIAENKAAIEINANEIKNKVSSDTFNAFSGEVQNQFTEISTTVEGVKTSVQNLDGKLTEVNTTVNGVTTRLGTAEADIESLKKQSDGSIDTHFGTEVPTLNNEPAVNWVTDDLKNEHTGDIYYNNNTGEAYRFSYNPETNEYFWIELTDSALTDALDKISKLESAVDGKVTIFYTTPTNYKYGDMWFVHEDNASFKKGTLVSATNLDKDTIRATLVLADWKEEIEYVNFDELTEELTSLNDYIDNAFKDGVLSEAEIKHIQELKKNFQLSYKEINDLNSFLIITAFATEENKTALSKAKKALDTAFNELIDAIDNLNTELDEDGNNPSLALYNAKYQAYLKALDDYTEIAVLIQSEAEQELLKPSDYIKQISSDGYLTPIEKKQLIAVWKQIAEEFTANRGIAFNYKLLKKEGNNYIDRTDIYDVDTGYHTIYNNYKNSYEDIASIFTDEADPFGFKDLQNTTILSETTIESLASIEQLFNTYYANLALFSEMVSKISNDITDAHQKVIDVTNALVDQLDPREAITQIGTGVVLSSVLGVKDINGNLEAVLNGSDNIEEAQSTKHGNHGKIVFAGGINGSSKWDDATTIIYEDGHVVINSGEISDFVSIGNATFKNVVEAVTQFDVISSPHVNPDTGEIEYIPLFQVNRNDAGEIIYVSSVYDFVGNREISALGFNAGGGSSGGGLISKVYNASSFGSITDNVNTATFNAYAIDSLYKRIVSLENKEVDLTGYATEAWVAGQGFITSAALSPYIKTADANDTFATKNALNNLSSSHDSLSTRVSTAEGNIITNAKGIADNKTAIATNKSNISANATAITNLGKRVTTNEGNIAEILKWFAVDADGNLYTTYNLYSTKEISANGLSVGTGGGGGGLISQVFGTTAFGTIASESNSATFNAYAIDSLYKRIVSLEGKATAVSFVPALTSGKQIGTLSIDGVSTVLYGVDAYSKTDADNTFLKLWGGTISVSGYYGLRLKSTGQDAAALAFENKDSVSGYLMYAGGSDWKVTAANWGATYNLLHSNNYSNYALPLTGGTISGSGDFAYVQLRIKGASIPNIMFEVGSSEKGAIGWTANEGVRFTNAASSSYLGIKDNGTPHFNGNALYHSGNFNPANYLPVNGGAIGAGNSNSFPLTISSTSAYTGIAFATSGGTAYFRYLGGSNWGVTDNGWKNSYSLIHSGNYNSYALPLSGGTLTGKLTTGQRIVLNGSILEMCESSGSGGIMLWNGVSSGDGVRNLMIYDGSSWNKAIHSGNYNSYAPKLDGTGATGTWGIDISGKARGLVTSVFATINANEITYTDYIMRYLSAISNTSTNLPVFSNYQNSLLVLPLHDNGATAQMYFTRNDEHIYYRSHHTAAWKTIAFTDSTVDKAKSVVDANGNALTLIHSGNIGEYKAGDSDKLGGVSETEYARYSTNIYTTYHRYIGYGTTTGGFPQNGGAVVAGITNYSMLLHGRNGVFRFNTMENGSLTGWKTVAFTDSNVASATKLATARTIWGQSFDGSGNVSGNIQGGKANFTIYGYNSTLASNVNILTHDNNKSLWLGYGMNAEGNSTIIAGTGIEFRYGTSRGIAAFINSSGNVGIGTTSPEYKLHVAGSLGVGTSGSSDIILKRQGGYSYITAATHLMLSTGGEAIGYALGLNSDKSAYFYGAVTMSSTLSVTGKVTANYVSVSYDGLRFSDNANYALFMDSSNKVNLSGYYGINLNGAVGVTGLLTANSGVKVASGQALTFLDASGKEHKLTYDSTAGAFKFDGNILVVGDGQFNAIN